jgi:hypothetical protein
MADKKQVRLTGPDGTVVRVSEDEATRIGGAWKSERKSPTKAQSKTANAPKE